MQNEVRSFLERSSTIHSKKLQALYRVTDFMFIKVQHLGIKMSESWLGCFILAKSIPILESYGLLVSNFLHESKIVYLIIDA